MMKFVHLVAMLAVAQYIFFAFKVGMARGKYNVKAPATSGHEMFDRLYRVQSNTLEQLVCFLPGLFVASLYWPPVYVASIGVFYLLGRTLYWLAYVSNPEKRGSGFLGILCIYSAVVAGGRARCFVPHTCVTACPLAIGTGKCLKPVFFR